MNKIHIKNESLIKKVIGVVFIVLGFSILLGLVCANSEPIFSREQYYSQTELDQKNKENYDKGYKDGINSYEDLNAMLDEYVFKNLDQEQQLKEKESEINTLKSENETLTNSLNSITTERNNAIKEKKELEKRNLENLETIASNETTITNLQAEIDVLTNDNSNNSAEIEELQIKVNSLKLQNESLVKDSTNNLQIITELNTRITNLESQVTFLTAEISENEELVAEYEANKIAWQNSIIYYESFISALETDTQAVAIFEVNGFIYKARLQAKNTTLNVPIPSNTETHAFVGWTLNGEDLIDLSTYELVTNTKFIAKFDIAYNVNFKLDDNIEYTSIKVAKNGYATELETLPTKEGYDFDGFTLNGVDIIDYTTYHITQDTTFIAKFTKVHTVTFILKNEVLETQQVRNGNFVNEIEIDNQDNYIIHYLVNDENVVLVNYPIYLDTTIVIQIIEPLNTLTEISMSGVSSGLINANIWDDGENIYYSGSDVYLVFNKETHNWSKVYWSIPSNSYIYGSCVFKVDDKIIYFKSGYDWVFDIANRRLTEIKHNGFGSGTYDGFIGSYIWEKDGELYYSAGSSKQYILDKETNTWVSYTWNGFSNFYGSCIWNDGERYYFSENSNQYVLDEETNTWVEMVWNGEFNPLTSYEAYKYIWTDGNYIYYSYYSDQYILDKETYTWVKKEWNGLTSFSGYYIFFDGLNAYLTGNKCYMLS